MPHVVPKFGFLSPDPQPRVQEEEVTEEKNHREAGVSYERDLPELRVRLGKCRPEESSIESAVEEVREDRDRADVDERDVKHLQPSTSKPNQQDREQNHKKGQHQRDFRRAPVRRDHTIEHTVDFPPHR